MPAAAAFIANDVMKIRTVKVDNITGLLNALREAIVQDNAEQVRLAELCKQLEEQGRNNDLQGALTLLNTMATEFKAVPVAFQHTSPGGIANG
jgi:hypothetical protein